MFLSAVLDVVVSDLLHAAVCELDGHPVTVDRRYDPMAEQRV
jgi:hypothetical protein